MTLLGEPGGEYRMLRALRGINVHPPDLVRRTIRAVHLDCLPTPCLEVLGASL